MAYIIIMKTATFAVLCEPNRLRILSALSRKDRSVGELVRALKLSQPAVSKHLKVMRDAGVVSCRVAAQQRIYYVESEPFQEIDRWLEPYRKLWTHHLDSLETYLDSEAPGRSDRKAGKRRKAKQ